MNELDAIRARLAAATPGPWVDRVDDLTDEVDVVHDQEQVSFVASIGDKNQPRANADAEFIAHAPTDIARLLAAVEAVEKLLCKPTLTGVPWNQPDLMPPFYSRRIREAITAALITTTDVTRGAGEANGGEVAPVDHETKQGTQRGAQR